MRIKVWTATTDGNNRPLRTTVHATEDDAIKRVRDDFSVGRSVERLAEIAAIPDDELPMAWTRENYGACIIDDHELSIPRDEA